MSKNAKATVIDVIVNQAVAILKEGFTEPGGDQRQAGTLDLLDSILRDQKWGSLLDHLPLEYANMELGRRIDQVHRQEFKEMMADRMETEAEILRDAYEDVDDAEAEAERRIIDRYEDPYC